MIVLIGCVAIGALIWLLAYCLGSESDAEKRRALAPIDRVVSKSVDAVQDTTMREVA
jgi:hypothetical protein